MRVSWPFRRARMGLAVSERSIVGVRAGDTPRVVRREIPAGLVTPAVTTPNIRSVAELARVVEEVLHELGARRSNIALVLPDLCMTTVLYAGRGGESNKKLWTELARGLAFPGSEARHDFWRGRGQEVLGAAVRRAVVRQYEQVVEASDCRPSWVDGASLAKLPRWAATAAGNGPDVQVQLYRSHYSVSVFKNGSLADLRTKLRTPGDTQAVQRELMRIPALHAVASIASLRLVGEDAAALAEALADDGVDPVQVEEEGEEGSLASSVIALLERSA